MHYLLYFLPILFPAMWIFVLFILSGMGWSSLTERFRTESAFTGIRIGIISGSINWVQYNNSLVLKFNAEGIHLQPAIFFRLFHPPIFIPWHEIKAVKDKKVLFQKSTDLIIGDPKIATINISQSLFKKLEAYLPKLPDSQVM